MSCDFPEVRVRQAAFVSLTESAGLTSIESLRNVLDVDIDDIDAAVHGGPVSPGFVASVLIMFPEHSFRDLFQLDIRACTVP